MPKHHKVSKLEQKIKNVLVSQQSKIEERKFKDNIDVLTLNPGATGFIASVGVLPTSSASVFSICNIGQGVDINQRVGNEIKVLSVNCKMVVNNFGQNSSMRSMLILDTQQISDTPPTISDIFTYWSPNNYLLNIANNKRFKILETSNIQNQLMTYDGSTLFSGGQLYPEMNLFQKFKYPLRVRYNGTTASDVQKNALYLVVLGARDLRWNGADGTDCKVLQTCRLKYIDG